MAFFDELGKKISQTGQGVVQKTKDATETLKLNSMISDEEKRVNELYTEIGKKYFELHSETFETELENMINGIKQSQSRISAFSEQVKKLKGVVRCPNCGGEVAYNSQFCNLCGAAILKDFLEIYVFLFCNFLLMRILFDSVFHLQKIGQSGVFTSITTYSDMAAVLKGIAQPEMPEVTINEVSPRVVRP